MEVRAVYQHAIDAELRLVERLVADCLRAKAKRLSNVRAVLAAVLAFVEGAFQLTSSAPATLPRGFAAETCIQLVTRYIDAEPAA